MTAAPNIDRTAPLKRRVLAVLMEQPGLTVAEVAAELVEPRPAIPGPVQGAEDYRRRQLARVVYAIAAAYRCHHLVPQVSRAVRRLQMDGHLAPSRAQLTPLGQGQVERGGGPAVVTRLLDRACRLGDLPPAAALWPVEPIAEILSVLATGPQSRAAAWAACGGSGAPAGQWTRAWVRGATLGLWWLPGHRLPTRNDCAKGARAPIAEVP